MRSALLERSGERKESGSRDARLSGTRLLAAGLLGARLLGAGLLSSGSISQLKV